MTRTARGALAHALKEVGVSPPPHTVNTGMVLAGLLLDALPEETREDGHKGHWSLNIWWDPEPAPAFRIEGEDE